MVATWSFEADYFTACNCDWGCPCSFNARPTQGNCVGWGVWRVEQGSFGATKLDGGKFGLYYFFPGLIEQGDGVARTYVDSRLPKEQQRALEAIATGNAGGGIFELFARQLTKTLLPILAVPIHYELDAQGRGTVRIEGLAEAESELLSYPDGSTIAPFLDLPHGIEYKRGLMTNAKRWWWRDDAHEALLASHQNKYGAVARVKFTQDGCVG
ncbi:MAG TPA: DUF1326 domain-containing protein [Candidatus Thermoplasmatota archaeon]|jgi:hypothetical protein|nr:DUF1326 domain-containing protein [Candidatus Thermoplasmatota archaeon]